MLPKQLGLVVVDEEQRFGVAQKELLRQMRLEVDVLALSATPIPRTLHMSLAGIRDITVIETPPTGRRPIATHVGEYDEELVRMAISRELEREGQAFVPAQPRRDDRRGGREAAPDPAAGAHRRRPRADDGEAARGRDDGADAARLRRARRHHHHRVRALDVPTANTLIIDRADMLGMSQLYQIRGRVGRSTRSAHAYLFSRARASSPRRRAPA